MIRTLHVDSSSGKGGSVKSLARLLQSNAAHPLFEPMVILGNSGSVMDQLKESGLSVQVAESQPNSPDRIGQWFFKKSPAAVQSAFLTRNHRPRFMEFDRLFKKNRALLLHANISPLQDYGILQAARDNNIPSVCHLRAWPPGYLRSSLSPAIPPGCSFVSVSEAVRAAWIRAGLPASSIRVVFNAHEPQDVPPADLAALLPEFLRARPLVCCIARFVSWKNHAFLLSSWARYRKLIPDAALILLGEGPLERSMKQLCQNLNLEDSVAFLGYRTDSLSILRSCQALVLPSLREPMARVILEAFGAGIPVVALNSGGTPEIVKNGITGLLTDENDAEGLIRALRKVLSDKVLALELARSSEKLLLEQFSPELHHRRISEIFEERFLSQR